ncbi:MAG: hypothetical protein WCV50_02435 [Patescibacteria group bacterium]|jgi:hypothetical protein
MPVNTQKIIKNLEAARRLSFSSFDKIILEPSAVKILVNLFLHPGCKSDINLAKFLTGQPVTLTEISPHIITAFPSQVAKFAESRGRLVITAADLLECFAIDHAEAVEENSAALMFEPSYALAHVLTVGQVLKVKNFSQRQLADIKVEICGSIIKFSHILVPGDLAVWPGQTVFHHFGVIVSTADSDSLLQLAVRLQKKQNQQSFIQKTIKQVLGSNIKDIDYAKATFFRVDMAGQIIKQADKDIDFYRLWQEEDLKKIKVPGKSRVMFQS